MIRSLLMALALSMCACSLESDEPKQPAEVRPKDDSVKPTTKAVTYELQISGMT